MTNRFKSVWRSVLLFVLVGGMLTAALPVSAAGEWYAEYFANTNLAGSPVFTRYEQDLTHEWGAGSPGNGVPVDGFSARFTQDAWFESGSYRFTYRSDDGLRMWINDVLVINDWSDHPAVWNTVTHVVPGGTNRVRIEYYERGGTATLQLGWNKVTSNELWSTSFWNNTSLSGPSVLQRQDGVIQFAWGTASPAAGVSADSFSARWSRTLGFEAGTYRFSARADDGVRVYVDGHRVVDAWAKVSLADTQSGDITLSQGNHTVVVEYFEQGGDAALHVWWNRLDPLQGWQGRYFDNRELRGSPAMIRDDAAINFDWGEGAPASWLPSDNFAVQWVRTINFQPGLYRLNARSDDGIRVWIDDTSLYLDHWAPQENVWHYQDWIGLSGTHTIRVEYFEGTGRARVQFWWDYAPTIPAARAMAPSPVYGFNTAPVVQPTPGPKPGTGTPTTSGPVQFPGPWRGEYFAGRDLTKAPVLVRNDEVIDFNWGWTSPAQELPVNDFAVRWTGTFNVEGGRYRFSTMTDDGVRLYVDDRLVLNSWRPMRGSRSVTVNLTAGEHTIRMEYFEATQAAMAQLKWQRLGQ